MHEPGTISPVTSSVTGVPAATGVAMLNEPTTGSVSVPTVTVDCVDAFTVNTLFAGAVPEVVDGLVTPPIDVAPETGNSSPAVGIVTDTWGTSFRTA